MIVDGFIFFNELDLLEIRMAELDPIVDRFVVVESTKTFTGKLKPLHFFDNAAYFKRFLPKVLHVIVDDMPDGDDPWPREAHQRNAIMRGLVGVPDDALLIMTDVDEIPRAAALAAALPLAEVRALEMRSFGGYVNAPTGPWNYGRVGPVRAFRESSPQEIRHSAATPLADCGWHFSSVGGAKKVGEKFDAFSHQEEAVQQFNNRSWIEAYAKFGVGILGGEVPLVPIDDSFPAHLRDNQKCFAALIGTPRTRRAYSTYIAVTAGIDQQGLDWLHHVVAGYSSAIYRGSSPVTAHAIATGMDRNRTFRWWGSEDAMELGECYADLVFLDDHAWENPLAASDALAAFKVFAGRATPALLEYATERFGKVDRIGADIWAVVV